MVVLVPVLALAGAACGLSALLRTRSRVRDALGVLALVVAASWVVTEVGGPPAAAFFLAALAGMVAAAVVNHRTGRRPDHGRRPREVPLPR